MFRRRIDLRRSFAEGLNGNVPKLVSMKRELMDAQNKNEKGCPTEVDKVVKDAVQWTLDGVLWLS